jgi:hypothetical protein
MICKNCGKEVPDGANTCLSCGTKIQIDVAAFQEAVAAAPVEPTKKKYPTKLVIGAIIAALLIIVIVIIIDSSGIEVDYGKFESTDEVTLSDFSVEYNSDVSLLSIKGEITSKIDCYSGITVYFDVYNEYDRSIATCKIETDALNKGEKYSFDDLYNIDAGSNIKKIEITDVLVF